MLTKRGLTSFFICISALLFIPTVLCGESYADAQTTSPQDRFGEAFSGLTNEITILGQSIDSAINIWKRDTSTEEAAKQVSELRSQIEGILNKLKKDGDVSKQLNTVIDWVADNVNSVNNDSRLSAAQKRELLDNWKLINDQIQAQRIGLNATASELTDLLENVLQQQGYIEHLVKLQRGINVSKHITEFITSLQRSMASIRDRLNDLKVPHAPGS